MNNFRKNEFIKRIFKYGYIIAVITIGSILLCNLYLLYEGNWLVRRNQEIIQEVKNLIEEEIDSLCLDLGTHPTTPESTTPESTTPESTTPESTTPVDSTYVDDTRGLFTIDEDFEYIVLDEMK